MSDMRQTGSPSPANQSQLVGRIIAAFRRLAERLDILKADPVRAGEREWLMCRDLLALDHESEVRPLMAELGLPEPRLPETRDPKEWCLIYVGQVLEVAAEAAETRLDGIRNSRR